MEGEDIFAVVCVLGMFGAAAYHIAMQIKNGLQERHREPPKPTPAEWNTRMSDPSSFTGADLNMICSFFGVTLEQLAHDSMETAGR